ncbi:MAG: PorV/PorQ family protein [Gemmatimonadales bacterium]
MNSRTLANRERMMRRAVVAALAALFAGVPAAPSAALAQGSADTRAAILLTLPSSARGLALGDAWGAVADDESALFYNPAQISRVRGLAIGGSLQNYIASTTLGAFAVAVPLRHGTLAAGLRLLDYGSADEVVPVDGSNGQVGAPTGSTITAEDMAFTLGYGIALGRRRELRFGAAVEYARQQVASYSGGAIAGDLGAAYTFASGWDVGAALQHVGSSLTLAAVTAPLPMTWRVALAAPAIGASAFTVRPVAEARQVSGAEVNGVLGAEGSWRTGTTGTMLSVRAGYAFRSSSDARLPFTAGGGITLGRLEVDYAYEGFDLIGGATSRVGVRFAALPRGM